MKTAMITYSFRYRQRQIQKSHEIIVIKIEESLNFSGKI
jgi:hypothetical protein